MGNMDEKSSSEVAVERPAVYVLQLAPMSEIDIFVCVSRMTDSITQNYRHHAQTIARHRAQY